MACRNYEKQLHVLEDYLDGHLGPADQAEVAAHLGSCDACREALEAAGQVGPMLRAALEPAGAPSGAFWTRMRALVRAEEHELAARGEFLGTVEWLSRRLAFSAGLTLLLILAFLAGSGVPIWDPSSQRAELREVFPDPERQPTSEDEVLLTLASSGR